MPELVTVFTEGRRETMGTEEGAWLRAGWRGARLSGSGRGQQEPASRPLACHQRALVAAPPHWLEQRTTHCGLRAAETHPVLEATVQNQAHGARPWRWAGLAPSEGSWRGSSLPLPASGGCWSSWLVAASPHLFLIFTGPLPCAHPRGRTLVMTQSPPRQSRLTATSRS